MSLEVDKSASYAAAPAENAGENAEKAQRKVALEVRQRLRRFANETPLTPKWAELVEPLRLVAGIAQQEADRVVALAGAAAGSSSSPTSASEAATSRRVSASSSMPSNR